MAIYKGNGIVWDAEKNKPLCKFEKGELHTTDQRTKDILDKLGYESDDEDEIVIIKDESFEDMGVRDLKAYCKEKKYPGYSNLSKEDLLTLISDKEGE